MKTLKGRDESDRNFVRLKESNISCGCVALVELLNTGCSEISSSVLCCKSKNLSLTHSTVRKWTASWVVDCNGNPRKFGWLVTTLQHTAVWMRLALMSPSRTAGTRPGNDGNHKNIWRAHIAHIAHIAHSSEAIQENLLTSFPTVREREQHSLFQGLVTWVAWEALDLTLDRGSSRVWPERL
jgi:hypothetical protein